MKKPKKKFNNGKDNAGQKRDSKQKRITSALIMVGIGFGLFVLFFMVLPQYSADWDSPEMYAQNLERIAEIDECDDFRVLPEWALFYGNTEQKIDYKLKLDEKFDALECNEKLRGEYMQLFIDEFPDEVPDNVIVIQP